MRSSVFLQTLEARRLFAIDLTFGPYTLSGDPLFTRGGTTDVTVLLRSDLIGSGTVTFKYVDVGFQSQDVASFDDPNAVTLETTATQPIAIPPGPAGTSVVFPITFEANLPAGKLVLLGRISGAIAAPTDVTQLFGVARVLPTDGKLVVPGTSGDDHISVDDVPQSDLSTQYNVNVNGVTESFSSESITAFTIDGRDGDDVIVATGPVNKLIVTGGDGDDTVIGGTLDDTLSGNAGKDRLYGGDGQDRLNGNGGLDRLYGEVGVDRLYGGAGNDYMDGGAASDRLDGGAGIDSMFGQGGNDRFYARDNEIDELYGGSGQDSHSSDVLDLHSSLERKLA